MYAFIDEHRAELGVEPICWQSQITPSGYHEYRVRQANLSAAHGERDGTSIYAALSLAYTVRTTRSTGRAKVWHQLKREGRQVARCTVERLMRAEGLRGVVRGRPVRTTRPGTPHTERPDDLVKRRFTVVRPNALQVADFTYVATWRGFVYVTFVIDVFSRRIVGWRARTARLTNLVLDALK